MRNTLSLHYNEALASQFDPVFHAQALLRRDEMIQEKAVIGSIHQTYTVTFMNKLTDITFFSRPSVLFLFLVGLGSIVFSGCARSELSSDSSAELSDEECLAFAHSIEEIVRSGDVAAFNKAIDWDAIVQHATRPTKQKAPEQLRDVFRTKTKENLTDNGGHARTIVDLARDDGEFRCLRILTKESTKRAIFRLLIPKKYALDYDEFVLSRQSDGTIRITDIDIYRSGEMLSKTIRRDYLWRVAAADDEMRLGFVRPEDEERLKADSAIAAMPGCVAVGDARSALRIYYHLPPNIQRERQALLSRISAANLVQGDEYEDAARELLTALPADPCLDIILPNYYLSHNWFDEYRAAMDRLDQRTGGDPYLDCRRALSYVAEKKPELARDFARKAIAADDTLALGHFILLELAAGTSDFEEVTRQLLALQNQSLFQLPDLTTIPVLSEYVKSPQYKAYLKQKKREQE